MAQLRYTDGSNGNGIRDFDELLRYFRHSPLAFYDDGFVTSYGFLFTTPEREAQLLAVFDAEGSSPETLRHLRELARSGGTVPEVLNKRERFFLRQAFMTQRETPLDGESGVALNNLRMLTAEAAAAGLPYTLCEGCTAAESVGHATDPLCRVVAATLKQREGGWRQDNVMMVCCAVAQFLRGRQPDDSEHLKNKLEELKAALNATPAEQRRLRAAGRQCSAAACARREPYAGAFKTCGRCREVNYCCAVCQVRCAPSRSAQRHADLAFLVLYPSAEDALGEAQAHLRAAKQGVNSSDAERKPLRSRCAPTRRRGKTTAHAETNTPRQSAAER